MDLLMRTWAVGSSSSELRGRDRDDPAAIVLIAYRRDERAVLLYGFAQSQRDNVEDDELETARDIAEGWLEANPGQLARAITEGLLQEVNDADDKKAA